MSLFTKAALRKVVQDKLQPLRKSAGVTLRESQVLATSSSVFDVFLSHSIRDSEVILGVKILLENSGLKVYVDWVEDPELDREKVDADTADRLRMRMKQCKSMVYAHSINSPGSKWMPWELGFFDGLKGQVAVFPIAETEGEIFSGQEYLGLYPYIDHSSGSFIWANQGKSSLWRLGETKEGRSFRRLDEWVRM